MTGGSVQGIDPTASLARLNALAVDAATDLILVSRDGQSSEVLASQPSVRLAAALRSTALSYAQEWSSRELIPYAPGQLVGDHQVMWVAAAEVPGLAIDALSDEIADLVPFDPSPETLRHIRLSAIRVDATGAKAVFLREINRTNGAGLDRRLPIFKRGDRLDLAPETTLFVERLVDAIVIDQVAFFISRPRFERVFGFLQQLSSLAAATFDSVTAQLEIANLTEFKAAATGQISMLGKLASIERKIQALPAYAASLTMPKLVAFIIANPHTGVKIDGSGSSAKLVFEADVRHRFKILKLLDDDYLRSQLTQMDYEANSKGAPF